MRMPLQRYLLRFVLFAWAAAAAATVEAVNAIEAACHRESQNIFNFSGKKNSKSDISVERNHIQPNDRTLENVKYFDLFSQFPFHGDVYFILFLLVVVVAVLYVQLQALVYKNFRANKLKLGWNENIPRSIGMFNELSYAQKKFNHDKVQLTKLRLHWIFNTLNTTEKKTHRVVVCCTRTKNIKRNTNKKIYSKCFFFIKIINWNIIYLFMYCGRTTTVCCCGDSVFCFVIYQCWLWLCVC